MSGLIGRAARHSMFWIEMHVVWVCDVCDLLLGMHLYIQKKKKKKTRTELIIASIRRNNLEGKRKSTAQVIQSDARVCLQVYRNRYEVPGHDHRVAGAPSLTFLPRHHILSIIIHRPRKKCRPSSRSTNINDIASPALLSPRPIRPQLLTHEFYNNHLSI